MADRRSSIVAVLALLVAAAIPIWVGAEGVRVLLAARRRVAGYLPIEATVVATSVDARRTGRGGVSYVPHVRYRYKVGEAIYESERTTVLDLASTRGWAEGVAARFHPGQTVTARYDPAHPEQAFLLETAGGLPYLLAGIGAVWLGGLAWIGGRWLLRRAPQAGRP